MFLWPQTPMSNTFLMISVLLLAAFMTWFTAVFLSLHQISPVLNKIIRITVAFMITISIPLIILDHYKLFFVEILILILLLLVLLLISTIIGLIRKNSESIFYACSWFLNIIGSFLYIGKVLGFLPSNLLTENTFQIGIIFQVSVLSVGVIVRIYLLLKKANQDLEATIEKRTVELRFVNEKLHELSMVDPLTGLYNRRYFHEQFMITAKIQDRSNQYLSILLIDVDFFKQYNDYYGHVDGDHCLQRIAVSISNSMPRKSDFCARYGGEEFIICLPSTDESGARLVAERLRNNILSQNIPHAKSSIADVVTISIGVCDSMGTSGIDLDILVQNADKALYTAKHNGRNQVCLYSLTEYIK
jgi:diguanylate cyclase (GGDEF)-like protein